MAAASLSFEHPAAPLNPARQVPLKAVDLGFCIALRGGGLNNRHFGGTNSQTGDGGWMMCLKK